MSAAYTRDAFNARRAGAKDVLRRTLAEMSERIAVATGKCDACGGQIVA